MDEEHSADETEETANNSLLDEEITTIDMSSSSSSLKSEQKRSRRGFLKGIAATSAVPILGVGHASSKETSKGNKILYQFDPDNSDEVAKAYSQLRSLPNENAVERAFQRLSDEQSQAFVEIIRNTEEVTFSRSDGLMQKRFADSDSICPVNMGQDFPITTSAARTYDTTSRLVNPFGGIEATFVHYIHFNYNCSTVWNVSHWFTQGTGILFKFSGLATNYLDDRGDEAVSRMVGVFNSCIGGQCGDQRSMGSEMWVWEGGGGSGEQLY